MSRPFKVRIPYRNEVLTALVQLRNQGFDLICSIRYLEPQVAALFPKQQLVFSLAGGLQAEYLLRNNALADLLERTSEAIARHLDQDAG
ncbi:MAG: hypothetical protein EOO11_15105 [Chitinophagaceae bacterium]|nr:MAG: hypothetical protein EOO11_15105 [Chitinophagaceae bacterium]